MDGDIDYSKFGRPQLEEALTRIDRVRYPLNYENLTRELSIRPPVGKTNNLPSPNLRLSMDAVNVVFVPTTIAYGLITVDWVALGFCTYALFLAGAALRFRLFANLKLWPSVSRIALFVGPFLLASGLILNVDRLKYWVLVPVALYSALSLAGGLALRRVQ